MWNNTLENNKFKNEMAARRLMSRYHLGREEIWIHKGDNIAESTYIVRDVITNLPYAGGQFLC